MTAGLLGLILLAGCAATPQPLTEAELQTYPDARGMPADVQAFIVRYDDCQHWLGEPDYDVARRRQIAHAAAANCPGIDGVAGRLRVRYSDNAVVLDRLRAYEPLGQ
jgi:hypothetical protein